MCNFFLFGSVVFGDLKNFLRANNFRHNFCILNILRCKSNQEKKEAKNEIAKIIGYTVQYIVHKSNTYPSKYINFQFCCLKQKDNAVRARSRAGWWWPFFLDIINILRKGVMYKDIAKYSNFKSKIYRIEYIENRVQCIEYFLYLMLI